MKKLFRLALIVAVALPAVTFVGCKKGENDPFLSLRSRKGRVAGEWKVTGGEGESVSNSSGSSTTTTWTYDGTQESSTSVTTSGSSTFTSNSTNKYTVDYTFDKDGNFTMTEVDNNDTPAETTTYAGTWNFTGGVGEMKNKSQLILHVTSISSGGVTTNYTGDDAMTMMYNIDQLKNKEMIFKSEGSSPSWSGSGTDTNKGSWTLTQE